MEAKHADHEEPILSVSMITEFLSPVFALHGVKKAILFGSHSKGYATANSDIDILVDSGLCGLDFVELIEDAMQAIQRQVDMIDIRHIGTDASILLDIEKTGTVIYEK